MTISRRDCPGRRLTALCFVPVLTALTAAGAAAHAQTPEGGGQFSRANTRLFLTNHLDNVPLPSILHYDFEKRGSLEEPFRDSIDLTLSDAGEGKRKVEFEYFTGARNQYVHPITDVEGNPVITIFLQRDVVDMQDRTDGSSLYFQNAIKQALEDDAQVKHVEFKYDGRVVDGVEIRVAPYLNDPHQDELKAFVNKYYVFTLSEAVPGDVYELRTVVPNTQAGQSSNQDSAALLVESLRLSDVRPLRGTPDNEQQQ